MTNKLLFITGVLFALLMLCTIPLSILIYKVAGFFTGEESLLIAGVCSTFIFCPLFARKWPEKSILFCFLSTFSMASLLAGLALYLANISETFLIPLSFYVICLVGILLPMSMRFVELNKRNL